ncbi:MAG: glycosyltransferase [Acidobacteriota bacterium]
MKSDGLGHPASGGLQARLRAIPDRWYGSLRHFLRKLIPFEHRRRAVRFIRRRVGLIFGDSGVGRLASLKALERVLDRTAPQTFDIICFPIIEWDFRFQRPQQLMSQFAGAGHRVFYINQNFRERGAPYQISIKLPNLYEVSLRGPDRNVYTDSLDAGDVEQLLSSLDQLRLDLSLAATTLIVQLPFWRPLVKEARSRFTWPVIYDCMDYHAGFSTNQPQMLDEEKDLIASSDCVLVSSHFLASAVEDGAQRMLLLRNGCDYDHFSRVTPRHSRKRPMVGYYGAIAHWFDTDLVADLADRHPEWGFLLIGSTFSADLSRLGKLRNISMVGEQPYSSLPDWLDQLDVLILPFIRSELTEATNPVKAYEILATGKPLVSVPIAEMIDLAPLVRLASGVREFEEQIAEALAETDPGAIEARRAFARENTWRKRFESLEPVLRESFPIASIIIVTYNNLELNRLCLQSLFTNTDWPHVEVIVVDNGSTDGSAEYLGEAKDRYHHLKVIFNSQNRGFAAANNQGLAEASGQYLVLLNNDTAVPRGWLSALIRHLARDRTIGIIGPVTNEIGNEAKVAVEYSNLADMPGWAGRYMRQHDGEVFEIPTLAMFCLAMPREVFEKVGRLDERFGIGMFEDDDYARRVSAMGYQIRCARDSFVHHVGGASFKKLAGDEYFKLFDRNRRLFEEKWGELWHPHEDQSAKQRLPELRERLRDIVDQTSAQAHEQIVFLAGEGWEDENGSDAALLARALSDQGSVVFFDCSVSQKDQFFGFKKISTTLFLYRGPTGALEELENPVVVAKAYHSSILNRWTHARVVYDCLAPLALRFAEGHRRLLETADIVLSDRTTLQSGNREQVIARPEGANGLTTLAHLLMERLSLERRGIRGTGR